MDEQALDASTGFSLADLADIDLTDIAEVRFESLAKGTYEFEVAESNLVSDARDGERRFKIEVTLKILEMLSSIEPGVNLDAMAGKTHTERFFFYPDRSEEEGLKAIGRVKAFIADIGGSLDGKFGDIVRDIKGTQFRGRIEQKPDRNDPSVSYARLRLEKKH
jgi:hypothetical protein